MGRKRTIHTDNYDCLHTFLSGNDCICLLHLPCKFELNNAKQRILSLCTLFLRYTGVPYIREQVQPSSLTMTCLTRPCLMHVSTCMSGVTEKYLPVRRWTMLHLLLIASERGVLGLKLFHKSSAWKKNKAHLCKWFSLVQLKWHGTSRSKKTGWGQGYRVTSVPEVFVSYLFRTLLWL